MDVIQSTCSPRAQKKRRQRREKFMVVPSAGLERLRPGAIAFVRLVDIHRVKLANRYGRRKALDDERSAYSRAPVFGRLESGANPLLWRKVVSG